jgi:DNA polymerase III alpha subunit
MTKNKFSELVYSSNDLVDFIMQGHSIASMIVDTNVNIDNSQLDNPIHLLSPTTESLTVEEFDKTNQDIWFMPEQYKDIDIAEYILGLCTTDAEIQRAGHELLLYNEKNLFNLLRYLKYLVDTMSEHGIIWGVGRGSSVASYVLYLLGVHKINSMYYNLDAEEFLR